jgi:hypothetical protein
LKTKVNKQDEKTLKLRASISVSSINRIRAKSPAFKKEQKLKKKEKEKKAIEQDQKNLEIKEKRT